MGTMMLEVQEIPVVVDTLVLKGDVLLVFNGACIGSREQREIPKARAAVRNEVTVTKDMILSALSRVGEASVLEIGDHLQLRRDDKTGRKRIGDIVRDLVKAKKAVVVETGRIRNHVYRLEGS